MVENRFKSLLPDLLRAKECVRDRDSDRVLLLGMSELLSNDQLLCVCAKRDHAVFF
jgi:hypothetical protein